MKFVQTNPFHKNTFFILFISILFIHFMSPLQAQNVKNDEFTTLVTSAENFSKTNEYEKAIDSYNKALALKPGDKVIIVKIAELKKLIEESDKTRHLSFEDAVIQGEDAFKLKEYPKAKKLFEQALDLDPSAKYPKDRLAAIRAIYVDPADVARFNDAMAKRQSGALSRKFR
ncbi:MAG: tetratricopeptide repeat protein [Bacteroidales bacterium]|nr:tetratricopeptide repeat protein [Bacteroidales bacterium]